MSMQMYEVSGLGGYLSVPDLSKKVRMAAMKTLRFGQFVRAEPGYGPRRSGMFYFDKVASDLGVTPTYNSDLLAEDQPIPEDTISITQGSVQVYEYGRAVSYSAKLVSLSQIAIEPIVEKVLRRRLAKVLDAIHAYAFKQSGLIYTPTGATDATVDTDGTASATATVNWNAFHHREAIDLLRNTYNCPPYFEDTDEYVCICTGRFFRGLYEDPEFRRALEVAAPDSLLRGDTRARYYNCRFVITNHAGALSNAVGNNGVLGEAIYFGDDPVVHGVVVAPEIRAKQSERDYGRSLGLAWYGLVGSGPTWVYSTDGEARTLLVTSA